MDQGHTAGGSRALAELIDEHGAYLAADLLTEFGLRLTEVVAEWPPREVLALVEVLPPTSRLWAHVQGGDDWRDYWGWGIDRHMQADIWDITALGNGVQTSKSNKKPPKYPRPRDKNKPPPGAVRFKALIGREL